MKKVLLVISSIFVFVFSIGRVNAEINEFSSAIAYQYMQASRASGQDDLYAYNTFNREIKGYTKDNVAHTYFKTNFNSILGLAAASGAGSKYTKVYTPDVYSYGYDGYYILLYYHMGAWKNDGFSAVCKDNSGNNYSCPYYHYSDLSYSESGKTIGLHAVIVNSKNVKYFYYYLPISNYDIIYPLYHGKLSGLEKGYYYQLGLDKQGYESPSNSNHSMLELEQLDGKIVELLDTTKKIEVNVEKIYNELHDVNEKNQEWYSLIYGKIKEISVFSYEWLWGKVVSIDDKIAELILNLIGVDEQIDSEIDSSQTDSLHSQQSIVDNDRTVDNLSSSINDNLNTVNTDVKFSDGLVSAISFVNGSVVYIYNNCGDYKYIIDIALLVGLLTLIVGKELKR